MIEFIELVVTFSWALILSMLVVPSIIAISYNKKLFNQPNHRSVHIVQTPTLGGIAIFAAFITALTIFGEIPLGVQYLLAGCLIIFFTGVQDDIFDIPALKKLVMQIVPAILVVVVGDVRITSFHGIFYIYELPVVVSYLFSIFLIIGITNAVNLIDGLDGLAGSLIIFISLAFGTYFYQHSDPFAFIAFALAGAVAGFLKYNFYKAKIFMGDSGSLFCGFIIAVMAIRFIEIGVVPNAPSLAIGVLIIPIFDTIKVFLIRILNGRSPFHPDKNHIHHKLMDLGLSQIQVVFVLLGVNVFVTGFMIVNAFLGNGFLLGVTSAGLIFLNSLLDLKLVRLKINVKENI